MRFRILMTACVALLTGTSCVAEEYRAEASNEPTRDGTVLDRPTQQSMSPDDVLAQLKEGNRRFAAGEPTPRDYLAQVAGTADGQFPKAAVLSCLDSRVPPELVFDQGIGDLFVGRVAGNFENVDMLGSLEFATKAAGSKLIVVLGHTSCGAVKGATDGVELGNLTEMLRNFDPALETARGVVNGPYDSSNKAYVREAVEANVRQTVGDILERSPVIAELVEQGQVAVVGAVYDLSTGTVSWLDP